MAVLQPIDIVNRACASIGDDPIQSMTEDTIGGQEAELVYSGLIEFCIGVYVFSFAKEMRQLSLQADETPLDGWKYAYAVPAESLGAPLRITDDATNPDRIFNGYYLRGNRVLSSCRPLFAEIKFLPEPARWSGTFREAVVTALTAKLALSRAADRNLYKELWEDAFGPVTMNFRGGLMGAAIQEDARANPPRRIPMGNNPLVAAWMS